MEEERTTPLLLRRRMIVGLLLLLEDFNNYVGSPNKEREKLDIDGRRALTFNC